MKQYGVRYQITSQATEFADGRVLEWRHPLGHRWRWELAPLAERSTLVPETFNYSEVGAGKAAGLKLFGSLKHDASGICSHFAPAASAVRRGVRHRSWTTAGPGHVARQSDHRYR